MEKGLLKNLPHLNQYYMMSHLLLAEYILEHAHNTTSDLNDVTKGFV